MYSRVLVPVDGSEPSNRGLREAIAIARENGSTLVLLHVVTFVPTTMSYAHASDHEEARLRIERAADELVLGAARQASAAGVDCVTRVADGSVAPVADTILARARSEHCELIVMGTHGRRGVARVVMGSDAEAVVRGASVPVMLVRAPVPA